MRGPKGRGIVGVSTPHVPDGNICFCRLLPHISDGCGNKNPWSLAAKRLRTPLATTCARGLMLSILRFPRAPYGG